MQTVAAVLLLAMWSPVAPCQEAPKDPPEADESEATSRVDPEKVNLAIDRGVDYLLKSQALDGSWGGADNKYKIGPTALCVYTLLKCGVRKDHPAVLRGIEYCRVFPTVHVYSTGCLAMALSAQDPEKHRKWLKELAAFLVESQRGGIWAYPYGAADLSNSQYAVLGLRAAEEAGVKVPLSIWTSTLNRLLRDQVYGGGWGYRKANKPTGSMLTAGLGIVRVCVERLQKRNKGVGTKVKSATREGLSWLAEHYATTFNPAPATKNGKETRWTYYYLYGLERAATFCDVEKLGEHNWYEDAATYLVGDQKKDGSWGPREVEPNTCFALLVLRRSSRLAVTGGGVTRKPNTYGKNDLDQPVSFLGSGLSPTVFWVSSFGHGTMADFEFDGEQGKGPHVARVEYLIDDDVVATVEGDRKQPAGNNRFAIQHRFEKNGVYSVKVRVHVTPRGDVDGELQQVESEAMAVAMTEIYEEHLREYAADVAENLLAKSRARIEASSFWDGKWKPQHAGDHLQRTAWLCKKDDTAPWLRIEPSRPIRCNEIRLSHTSKALQDPGHYARATRIEVVINARKPLVVELDPDDCRKNVIRLDKPVLLRRLEIRVTESVPGSGSDTALGFAEVELFSRRTKDKGS